jgi:TP901-1 family phage major tail protein
MAVTYPAKGRAVTVKRGTSPTLIAGVRTKSMSINGEPIDVTNDDDAGVRKLMDEPGELSMEITVSGIVKSDTLRVESLSTTDRVLPTEFGFPGSVAPGKIAGDFYLASYSETGEYQGAATFEATFQSTGALVYTAAT